MKVIRVLLQNDPCASTLKKLNETETTEKIEDVQNKQWQQKQDELMTKIQKTCEKYNLTSNNGN